jgi:Protein of unknown function (DUF3379)
MFMQYDDFKRQLEVNPRDPALREIARDSGIADAQMLLARALAFEDKLADSLNVAVPVSLQQRISAAVDQYSGVSSRRRMLFAIAAGVTGISVAGLLLNAKRSGPVGLTAQLIEDSVGHLQHEPFAVTRTDVLAEAVVRSNFAPFNVSLAANTPPLVYAHHCPVGRCDALHMVTRAKSGPVTMLYLHDAGQVERSDFAKDRVAGRLLRAKNGSALAFLAETDRDFDALEMAWRRTGIV